MTQTMASIPVAQMGRSVGTFAAGRDQIVRAIDALLSGICARVVYSLGPAEGKGYAIRAVSALLAPRGGRFIVYQPIVRPRGGARYPDGPPAGGKRW